jgi:FtsP/CotA-like multicopper oxidase with cupredoxin domain
MKMNKLNPSRDEGMTDAFTSRRQFVRTGSLAALALAAAQGRPTFASAHAEQSAPAAADTLAAPDYRIEIAQIEWEIAPKKKIRTTAYNGQIPGQLIRLAEGKPATIEIVNKLDRAEIVHWHGQWIPTAVDGSMEEGSPMIPPGGTTRISFSPNPSGLHWYHTHAMANRDLKRGLYSGQFGPLYVDPREQPGRYDQEKFILLHDWQPYYSPSDDGSMMVNYAAGSINGRMLGHDDPIQVREGQRVLFHIVNASATEVHWLNLPGHQFTVMALDGRPVPTQAQVETLRLGPGERVSALVTMDRPGIWVLGESRASFRDAGIGTIVEYAARTGKPQSAPPARLAWNYRTFADQTPTVHKPEVTIPLVFSSRFEGHGALDRWMINGKSYPDTAPLLLQSGLRHRLVFDNRSSIDDHPVHIHRHDFELVSIGGAALSGVYKDVVIVEAGTVVEADLVANNPGNTLFHCHQQDHMDSGFMALFRYTS